MNVKKIAVLLVGLLIGYAKVHRDDNIKKIEEAVAAAPGSPALDRVNAVIEHVVPSFLRTEVDKDLKEAEAAGGLTAAATIPQAYDFVVGLLKQVQTRVGA